MNRSGGAPSGSKMELEWLKKNLPSSLEATRAMIELGHPGLSIRHQCELVGLNRASFYYTPATESALNLELMVWIDKQYMQTPFFGWPRMTIELRKAGYRVNHKRIQRLMQLMGLQAIYPKPRTTIVNPQHRIYPYLLRGVEIVRPNQVWSTDITYVPMAQGFMFLTAIIDWYSRYILAWQLSNTLDGHFCRVALHQALTIAKPEIFNTDQGSQFTVHAFTSILSAAEIQISMDGRGRALDNIFIERFWRSIKYEDIYINEYGTVSTLIDGLGKYFPFYNDKRPHQSLGYRTPAEVYWTDS